VEVDTSIVAAAPGDLYLLCSDGLHGYVRSESEIARVVGQGGQVAVERLIELANLRGGRDNITAVLVEVF
jgi:protein phosphatase